MSRLRVDELAALLEQFRYMPGWTFTIHDHPEAAILRIEFGGPDSRDPDTTQTQRVDTFIPPVHNARQFWDWLKWRLDRIGWHEVSEWFQVDDQRPYDPHVEP